MNPLSTVIAVALASSPVPGAAAVQLAPQVSPELDEVAALDEEARQAYAEREYALAADAFSRAYDASGDPNYLFNAGRVYEESGDLEHAVEYYDRFLSAGEVELEARKDALERLQVLRGVLDVQAKKKAADSADETNKASDAEEDDLPEPLADRFPSPEPSPAERAKRKRLTIAGAVLAGTGGAALIAGGVLGGLVLRQSDVLDKDEVALEDRRRRIDATETYSLTADILFVSGGVLAITGIALIVASAVRSRPSQSSARLQVTPGLSRSSASLQIGARF
ncbi:MAG: hypothetical protein KUG77_06530 [Nannocystaceae bacterium]|nr:hypothetical protein [Nannocystaceae bacterium]